MKKFATKKILISKKTTIKNALKSLSLSGKGCLLVMQGQILNGTLTDGDLRRNMKKDIIKIIKNQLQDNKDPRFSYWLFVPGILLSVLWSCWKAVNVTDNNLNVFIENMIWPGVLIFFITTLIAILGWQLDID